MRENKLEINEIPDHLCCPITGELMTDPVCLSVNGKLQSYERSAITAWLKIKSTDPRTGVLINDTALFENIALKNAVDHYKEQQAQREIPKKPDALNYPIPPIPTIKSQEETEIKPKEQAPSRRSLGLFGLPPVPFSDKPDYVIKIGILGSRASGGGQIIHRYLGGEFRDSFDESYYCPEGTRKTVIIDGKKIDLRIFRDPYGQDPRGGRRCRIFPRDYYDCIIITADLTDFTTRRNADIIQSALLQENLDKRPVIFVGTKSDSNQICWNIHETVPHIPFDHIVACSAKRNENISELFELAIRKRIELLENPRPIDERNKKVPENIPEKDEGKCLVM